MKELLQQIDTDYYRSVQLLIAQAEVERLRNWRVDVERRSKIPLGVSRSTHIVRTAIVQSLSPEVRTSG
jgi:hypothetical protein